MNKSSIDSEAALTISVGEIDVLELLAHGRNAGEIARLLQVNEREIERRISLICTKFSAKNISDVLKIYNSGQIILGNGEDKYKVKFDGNHKKSDFYQKSNYNIPNFSRVEIIYFTGLMALSLAIIFLFFLLIHIMVILAK